MVSAKTIAKHTTIWHPASVQTWLMPASFAVREVKETHVNLSLLETNNPFVKMANSVDGAYVITWAVETVFFHD